MSNVVIQKVVLDAMNCRMDELTIENQILRDENKSLISDLIKVSQKIDLELRKINR